MKSQQISRFMCGVIYYQHFKSNHLAKFKNGNLRFDSEEGKNLVNNESVKWSWINGDQIIPFDFQEEIKKFLMSKCGNLSEVSLSKTHSNNFLVELDEFKP